MLTLYSETKSGIKGSTIGSYPSNAMTIMKLATYAHSAVAPCSIPKDFEGMEDKIDFRKNQHRGNELSGWKKGRGRS
jgi:hypothetical protein